MTGKIQASSLQTFIYAKYTYQMYLFVVWGKKHKKNHNFLIRKSATWKILEMTVCIHKHTITLFAVHAEVFLASHIVTDLYIGL